MTKIETKARESNENSFNEKDKRRSSLKPLEIDKNLEIEEEKLSLKQQGKNKVEEKFSKSKPGELMIILN